jgi:dTDP-4-amino-4,6-dideoxygalactose transaminase
LFSIHKWTASHAGGLVRGQVQLLSSVNPRGASVDDLSIFVASDISEITNIRWRNYLHIDRRLADSSKLQRFWSSTQDVSCPLNFPIVLNSVSDRSELYSLLISKGLKPTSLYHKLTQYLDAEKFPSAYRLADTILNLPVHQDCSIQDIDELVNVINEWALVSS